MSVAQEHRVASPEPGSDRAVVEAVRAGEIGQFALLYERYRDEALRIARRQVGPDEAQDLVQETFARVLRAIQNGGGPTEDVAGYIFRTLRNLRIDRGGQREFATEDVEKVGPAGLWVVPDTSEEVLDRGLVADAFAELPPRWREVLWLTEVEGVGPSELSDRMGIKPTAVSTLSLRARAGFRSAWLQAHVRAGSAPTECRSVVTRLGDYQTGRLSSRRREQVQEHLDHCDHCPGVVAELVAVSDHLGALLLPVVILAPKALWWLFGGWGVKAGLLLWGAKTTLNRLRDPKVAISSVGGAATVAVATAVAMAMTAGPEPPPAADPAPAVSAPAAPAPSSPASPAASDDSGDEPEQSAPADDAPADSPVSVPPAASDVGGASSAPAVSAPMVAADEPAAQEPAGAVADPAPTGTGPEPAEPEPTDPGPTTDEPTDPEPTDPEPTDPEPSGPSAPNQLEVLSGPTSGEIRSASLVLSGSDAVPGATITASDDDGAVVAESTVMDDGSWTVTIHRPEADQGEPADENQGDSASEMATPAGAGAAARGVAARSLADAVAERDADQVRDGHDGRDSGDDGDDGEGDDEAEEYNYTLVQHVAEGSSEDFVGASEPLMLGPYTWVSAEEPGPDPDPDPDPEPVGSPMILSPTAGELVRMRGASRDFDVTFCRDQELAVQFSLDGDVIGVVPANLPAEDEADCEGGASDRETATVQWAPAGTLELTLQYLDEDGEEVGEASTVRFTACVEPGCDAAGDEAEAPEDEGENLSDQAANSGDEIQEPRGEPERAAEEAETAPADEIESPADDGGQEQGVADVPGDDESSSPSEDSAHWADREAGTLAAASRSTGEPAGSSTDAKTSGEHEQGSAPPAADAQHFESSSEPQNTATEDGGPAPFDDPGSVLDQIASSAAAAVDEVVGATSS